MAYYYHGKIKTLFYNLSTHNLTVTNINIQRINQTKLDAIPSLRLITLM